MKSFYILIFILLVIVSTHAEGQVIPNAGFENWTGSGPTAYPTNWFVLTPPNSVVQSTGRTGLYAMRMRSVFDSIAGYYVGGLAEIIVGPVTGYYPTALHGYWRTQNFNVDMLGALIKLYDANFDSVGQSVNLTTPQSGSLTSWTPFTVGVSGGVYGGYYSILINYFSVSHSALAFGEVDDLSLTVITANGEEIIKLTDQFAISTLILMQEYVLNMDLLKSQELTIQLINLNGQIILSSQELYGPGHNESKLDLSGLPRGIYVCRVSGDGFSRQFTLMNQR